MLYGSCLGNTPPPPKKKKKKKKKVVFTKEIACKEKHRKKYLQTTEKKSYEKHLVAKKNACSLLIVVYTYCPCRLHTLSNRATPLKPDE